LTFQVFGQEVNIISDETDCGRTTVAELQGQYYYLGDEPPTIASAIFAWQELNKREMDDKELHQVFRDNGFIEAR
jgi:hypothetical protein